MVFQSTESRQMCGFFLHFWANSLKLYVLLTPCVAPRSPDEATELTGVLALAAVRRVSAVTTRRQHNPRL